MDRNTLTIDIGTIASAVVTNCKESGVNILAQDGTIDYDNIDWSNAVMDVLSGYDIEQLVSNAIVKNVENDDGNIYVTCPGCDNCESHPIDEQRHHLQSFDIEWCDSETTEISLMQCRDAKCKQKFYMTWNYDKNIVKDEE